ncbi:MAG: ABC transporter ATP-binding protein [Actinobacteria bacterium]|nr:ABC transporter ATP-binding protein [Actinomycetota bacterium]
MEKIIEAHELKKIYGGRKVLDVEHIFVKPGEILTVLGPSGAGKSVLLRLLNLLEKPTSGKILFNGNEVQSLSGKDRVDASRRMAMLFQEPLLFKTTIFNNIAYGLKIRRKPRDITREKVESSLELVRLSGFEKKMPSTLSGGEAQRIALARAMVTEPSLLFLDEPFANLDRLIRRELQVEVKRILKENGLSAVFVTHDQEEAARMGDRIMILNKGRLVQEGTPIEVFYSPKSEFAARFVGMDNMLRGVVRGNDDGLVTIDVDGKLVEATGYAVVGETVNVGLRPEDITITPVICAGEPTSSRNALPGRVTDFEFAGPVVKVTVECPFKIISVITRRSYEELDINNGNEVCIRFKATSVNVFEISDEPHKMIDPPRHDETPPQDNKKRGNPVKRLLRHVNEK